MEFALFFLGFFVGAFAGMWYACRAVRAGSAPTVSSVLMKPDDGGGPGPDR